MKELVVKIVPVGTIIPLRHRILRPGLPIEKARFEGDELPTTYHFALYQGRGEPLVCGSYFQSADDGTSFQFRGMATDEKYQRKGLGQMFLCCSEFLLLGIGNPKKVSTLWCNARVDAIPFYERSGWSCMSEAFKMEGVGMHRKMVKQVK